MFYCCDVQSNISDYAVYHSVHDNFYWMTHFGDPDFSHHKALGLWWVNIALSLLTAPVLPGKAEDFGFIVEEIFENLNKEYGDVLDQNGVSLGKPLASKSSCLAEKILKCGFGECIEQKLF